MTSAIKWAYAYWQTTREALNPCWEQLQREGRREVQHG
jgi:hypothetical protein